MRYKPLPPIAGQPMVGIVLPCTGRLEHAKLTLPNFIRQTWPHKIVLVSYCEESDKPLKELITQLACKDILLVTYESTYRKFTASHCRNIGFKACPAPFIAFTDIDGVWPEKTSLQQIMRRCIKRGYWACNMTGSGGSLVMHRSLVEAVDGYNEVHMGGGEDADFAYRIGAHFRKYMGTTEEPSIDFWQHHHREFGIRMGNVGNKGCPNLWCGTKNSRPWFAKSRPFFKFIKWHTYYKQAIGKNPPCETWGSHTLNSPYVNITGTLRYWSLGLGDCTVEQFWSGDNNDVQTSSTSSR